MLLYVALASLVAWAAGAPLRYDQSQDGMVNVAADLQNVLFVIAIPQKMSRPLDILDYLESNNKHSSDTTAAQDGADHVMDAIVEPGTPNRVEIGTNDRSTEDPEEIKLIGATEQCGPDRERDPVTLTCRFLTTNAAAPEPQDEVTQEQAPEVIPL